MNRREDGGDLVLLQTFLFFILKSCSRLVRTRIPRFAHVKEEGL